MQFTDEQIRAAEEKACWLIGFRASLTTISILRANEHSCSKRFIEAVNLLLAVQAYAEPTFPNGYNFHVGEGFCCGEFVDEELALAALSGKLYPQIAALNKEAADE
ncbi:hypothetical protein M0R72_10950 [Candidatus Pacearchaeota archaeon]|jgi:hypothetical protein|nr:hypothetical protein [Candidatus Pacearchaeota archaeon]